MGPELGTQVEVVTGMFVLMGVAAVAMLAFAYSKSDLRTRRELRSAPLFRIADLADGVRGRVTGRAYPLTEALRAPLSGRPCVHFVARVDERVENDDGSESWRNIIDESHGVPFGIQDSSGRAIIDATGARLALDVDGTSQTRAFGDKTEVELAFLARHGLASSKSNKKLRYSEAIIGVDEVIAVLGSGVREPDPDASPTDGYRGELPTRLRLTSSAAYPLVISDAPTTTT